MRMPQSPRHGFTLIELLVSIGVVGVLLSMLIPAVGSARRAAGEAASLARLSQLAVTIEAWGTAHDTVYPRIEPGKRYGVGYPTAGAVGTAGIIGAEGAFAYIEWPAVVREMFPFPENAASWISPGRGLALEEQQDDFEAHGTIGQFIPSYELCLGFNAAPKLWTPEGAAAAAGRPGEFVTPVRTSMVAYPAGKAMMFDAEMSYDRRRGLAPGKRDVPVLFADGHAAARPLTEASTPFPTALIPPERAGHKLHNTPNGVAGTDF